MGLDRSAGKDEIAARGGEMRAAKEIEVQAYLANKFPRDPLDSFRRLMVLCERLHFAEKATYYYERGDTPITGPSAPFARSFAALWGNILYGTEIVWEDEENRRIRSWAWDLQSNARTVAEDQFAKLIYRKKSGWVVPDERDLRELTNRRAAITERNCILKLLPPDLVDDAVALCIQTEEKGVSHALAANADKVVKAFAELGVGADVLLAKIGRKAVGEITAANVVALRAIYRSIVEGQSTVEDQFYRTADKPVAGDGSVFDGMKPVAPSGAKEASGAPTGATGPSGSAEGANAASDASRRVAEGTAGGRVGEREPGEDVETPDDMELWLDQLIKERPTRESLMLAVRKLKYPEKDDPAGIFDPKARLNASRALPRLKKWYVENR